MGKQFVFKTYMVKTSASVDQVLGLNDPRVRRLLDKDKRPHDHAEEQAREEEARRVSAHRAQVFHAIGYGQLER
jgi:hypothetical protein